MPTVNLTSQVPQGSELRTSDLSLDVVDDIAVDSAFWYVDRETGNVWEREPQAPNDSGTGWVDAGRFLPLGDGDIPVPVTGLAATGTLVLQPDGSTLPAFSVSWNLGVETDLTQYEVQWESSPASWATPYTALVGSDVNSLTTPPVLGGTAYDFRIRVLDLDNTPSAWSGTVTATSLGDTEPPPFITGLTANPGYRMVGLAWNRSSVSDLATYQVRYYVNPTVEADPTNLTTLKIVDSASTNLVVTGLAPDEVVWFQVRAVDRSGNVSETLSGGSGTLAGNNNYGWCDAVSATPVGVGAADVAFNSIVSNFVSTGTLSADSITAGTLALGGALDDVVLKVYDDENEEMLTISKSGMVMVSTSNPANALWATGEGLRFSEEYDGNVSTTNWSTAVTASGINASAITFGTETGGHNRIANSGMEGYAFPTTALTTKTWTASVDWATATSTVNLNTGGTSLTMTGV